MHDSNSAHDGEAGVVVRKRRKGIYILPNLFTLAALFGGFYAIVMAMNGRYDLAAYGIFCAMVLDALDAGNARIPYLLLVRPAEPDGLQDQICIEVKAEFISAIAIAFKASRFKAIPACRAFIEGKGCVRQA